MSLYFSFQFTDSDIICVTSALKKFFNHYLCLIDIIFMNYEKSNAAK